MIKNILFIERKLNPNGGGVQRVSHLLGEGFRNKGFNVWYGFYMAKTNTESIPDKFKFFYSIAQNEDNIYRQFAKFIEEHHIDLLFCQNVYMPTMCKVYAKLKEVYGVKIIACLHANPDMTLNKNSWSLTRKHLYIKDLVRSIRNRFIGDSYVEEMRMAYQLSDRYVLLSERFIPIFTKILRLKKDSKKLIGVNNPATFKQQEPSIISLKENIVLVVGRMEEGQKRISNILTAWKEILHRHNNWKLVIVGEGPDLEYYKKKSSAMHLSNIEFTGSSNHVEKYYAKAKIFLMTSIWEGFSMTLVESLSFGCVPVVIDNFAAVHDIINGNNGIVTPSNKLDTFIDAINSLMTNSDLLKDMAQKAISSSVEKFDKDKIINRWIKIISDINS